MSLTTTPAGAVSTAAGDDQVDHALVIEGLRKGFVRRNGSRVPAVDDIDLTVEKGEFVVLLGPSGCGKTTLLRCIAGLEEPDAGTIRINGSVHYSSAQGVNSPPDRRRLGMIFQSYALWPHMKVSANVAYPLKLRRVPRAEVRTRVAEVLGLVGISELAEQYPGQLSGGQQQRVAVARALVSNNGLVLFDEPLSNVDAKVREQLRYEILRMQREIGFAAIYVTHDQDEAMELADRIAVLDSGKIAQLDSPEAVYESPADLYVAKFVGATNEITGTVESIEAETVVARTAAGLVHGRTAHSGLAIGDEVSVIVRPERLLVREPSGSPQPNSWDGRVVTTLFMGDHRGAIAAVEGWGDVRVHLPSSEPVRAEQLVRVSARSEHVRMYRTGKTAS